MVGRLLKFSIILFVFLISCSSFEIFKPHNESKYSSVYLHKNVYVDNKFDDIEKQYIIEAGKEWELRTHNLVEFNFLFEFSLDDIELVNSRYALIIKKANKNDEDFNRFDKKLQDALGVYDPRPNTPIIYILSERLDFTDYKATVMHELGHSLFLKHSNSGKAIMYPYIGKEDIHKNIHTIDLEQFCDLYQCFLE